MKIDNVVLTNKDILNLLSKTEPNFHCVFIQPNGIINGKKIIEELKLTCEESNLMTEDLLLEIYDNRIEAENRILKFTENQWLDNFYVSCYKNGKFICDNQIIR